MGRHRRSWALPGRPAGWARIVGTPGGGRAPAGAGYRDRADEEGAISQPDAPTQAPAAAGLGLRFAAKTIDWLLLWTLFFALALVAMTRALGGAQPSLDNLQEITSSTQVLAAELVGRTIPGLYFTVAEGLGGATLGKRLTSLQVIGADGSAPGLAAAFRRNLWAFAFLLPQVAGVPLGVVVLAGLAVGVALSVRSDAASVGWHDRLAETRVIPRR